MLSLAVCVLLAGLARGQEECTAPNGITGICMDNVACTGTNHSGLCPGSSNIQCCTDAICSIPGVGTGVCRQTTECGGTAYPGYCPGSASIQCCFNHNPNPSELRGVWVATVANIDWPSYYTLTTQQQQDEAVRILDLMVEMRMNAVFLQVRPEGDAFYDSSLEPWSFYLEGRQGQAPSPYYDPLQFWIANAHARGIEVHAWFNPYRAALSRSTVQAPNHMCELWPQYCYHYGASLTWMDPGSEEVANHTVAVIMDVLTRYDLDGIHMDDYFYPYPESGYSFPDSATYNAYRSDGGNLSLDDWRRDNVNRIVKRIWDEKNTRKPQAKFSISPFGIYRPGEPPGITGLDQYAQLYADVKLWLQQGWVDVMMPQLYWQIDPPQQSYDDLLYWWSDPVQNPLRRYIVPGNAMYRLGESSSWNLNEFSRQIVITRDMYSRNVVGNCWFSFDQFLNNLQGCRDWIEQNYYNDDADSIWPR